MVHKVEAEWDPSKARANLRKHRVHFADAVTALEDVMAMSISDEGADEERWVTIGMDSLGRILVVVYTWRNDRVRLISARPATLREVHQYEERI
ncbi:BrnT family toxin [Paludibaculum fermentans]|uniref:BrnT family toxin n=1 Tax=Paludibaculum fermentans TaxID=1473598 RepID=UPI001E3E6488|nr:BrnT family toxin [Paludibaculum fermentans]